MLLIVNPASARGATMSNCETARREFVRLGIEFSEHRTSGPGEATLVARNALREGATRIVAVGGDGTLNEVIAGYFDESGQVINEDAAVGLIPSGTGSDFRRSIGLKTGAQSIESLVRDHTRSVDVAVAMLRDSQGRERSRYFINVATFGLGGEAVALVNAWRATWPVWIGGKVRFIAAALSALRKYRNRPVSVRLDDEPELRVSCGFVVVANGRYAGSGMKLAPTAEIDDGKLDVLLTDGLSRLGIARELLRVWKGDHVGNPKVITARAQRIAITSNPEMAVDIDGEATGFTPIRIEVLPRVLRFLV